MIKTVQEDHKMQNAPPQPPTQPTPKTDKHRQNTLDPNVSQNHASDPTSSAWVDASAGTGKTKVLTDRILRLLLPDANGQAGTQPHKILCITFTKAAASEMALRIHHTLARWSTLAEEALKKDLEKLLKRNVSHMDVSVARKLFAAVTDKNNDLKIQTIHAFCQSLLGRFPLEAGLRPGHTIIEEKDSLHLFKTALKDTIRNIKNEPGASAHQALMALSQTLSEDALIQLIQNVCHERIQLDHLKHRFFGIDGLYETLCRNMNIRKIDPAQIVTEACADEHIDKNELFLMAQDMVQKGSKIDIARGTIILDFLSACPEERRRIFLDHYIYAYVTKTHKDPRKKLITNKIINLNHDYLRVITTEQDRVLNIVENIKKVKNARDTYHILTLSDRVNSTYKDIKTKRAVLDFEDLIFYTKTLLSSPDNVSWVMYKLDQGLDHILVDEAQDTNPEQWDIIQALCRDFFSGKTAHDDYTQQDRTLFVVGDEKQSIYSFQRATPEKFFDMRKTLKTQAIAAHKSWTDIDMNISFRSCQTVLDAVNAVFTKTTHRSYRTGQGGTVELWPLVQDDEFEPPSAWDGPFKIWEKRSNTTVLAQNIAHKIHDWLAREDMLHSHNRPIRPADIMILVRTRSGSLTHDIIRQCKLRGIPIGGMDRLVLNEDIAIQDLIAAAGFALDPHDDLTLACLLKSPLIGLSENGLFDLAYEREGSLWESLLRSDLHDIKAYLQNLIRASHTPSIYTFFNRILTCPCPADSHSGLRGLQIRLGQACLDPIEEFLNLTLTKQTQDIPTLHDFIHWFNRENIEIKREQPATDNAVRLMTVHGAKGLQAPIVILPDTVSTPENSPKSADKRLLWPDKTGFDTPLFSPNRSNDSETYTAAMNTIKSREMAEYNRLLYVAMTRAEDRLYIAGVQPKKNIAAQCWYAQVKTALEKMNSIYKDQDGTLRLHRVSTREGDRDDRARKKTHEHTKLPAWSTDAKLAKIGQIMEGHDRKIDTYKAAPQENIHLKRGRLIHKLLEILPALPADKRFDAGMHFFNTAEMTKEVYKTLLDRVLKILDMPEFSRFFMPDSRAEVPISYTNEQGTIINNVIDRLIVTKDIIWILDYKTDQEPAKTKTQIPQKYITQLDQYARAIKKIYPEHTVKSAILWIENLEVMELS
jgi:ATP-dependent helicase/nuclease subunit A